jgi:catechol 2,3-dioxygenase
MSLYHQQYNLYIKSVTLNVKDLQRSKQFYTKTLGLSIIKESRKTLDLGATKDEILLHLIEVNNNSLTKREGLYHIALLFPSKVAMANTFIHMIEKHYPFAGAADHGVSESVYLEDPDGNGIELYYDRPEAQWPVKAGHLDMYVAMIDINKLMQSATSKNYLVDPATIIGHVHLRALSIGKMYQFYVDLIGFNMMVKYGSEAIFLSDAKYHHHLGINAWDNSLAKHDVNDVGLQGISLIVPSLRAKDFIAKLKKNDIHIFNDGFGDFIYDPIGLKVRLLYVN